MSNLLIHTPRLFKNEKNELVSDITYLSSGLFSIASEIKKEGIDVEILHLGVEKYLDRTFLLSDYIKKNNVKFLAFSLQWHLQSYDTIETIRVIKEKCPDIYVTLGGVTASYFADEILNNFPFIDSIVKGEGEIPMRLLAKGNSNIPNLITRDNKSKEKFVATNSDLDSFEYSNMALMKNYETYSKIPYILNYAKENEFLTNPPTVQGVVLGRGCMGNCSYCGGGFKAQKNVSGRDFISYRNSKSVIDEIKSLKDKGIEVFRFVFDPHPKNRKFLIDLFSDLKKEFRGDLTVEYTLNSIPDKNFLDAFIETFSTNSKISIPADFYNEDLRKKYRSFFYANKDLEEILSYMDKLQIKSDLFFSTMPIVSDEENKKSLEYGDKLKSEFKYIQNVFNYPIEFEPASPLFDKNIRFVDYYNETKCIQDSFENVNIF